MGTIDSINQSIIFDINSMKRRIDYSQNKEPLKSSISAHNQIRQSYQMSNPTAQPQQNYSSKILTTPSINYIDIKEGTLRQKHQSRQVSALYSEHIYKLAHRDYLLEAQLEKYKQMLREEKRKKVELLASQKEWRLEKNRMVEEKKIIMFALDSLTLKIQEEAKNKYDNLSSEQSDKKSMQLVKTNKMLQQEKDKISDEPDDKIEIIKPQNNDTARRPHDFSKSTLQKLRIIQNLKKHLNSYGSDAVEQQDQQIQEIQIDKQKQRDPQRENNRKYIEAYKLDIKKYKAEINNLITEKDTEKTNVIELQKKIKQMDIRLHEIETELNRVNTLYSKEHQENIKLAHDATLINQRESEFKRVIRELECKLQLTIETNHERQSREQKHIERIQKFSKDLKLSDEKIQQFLNTIFGSDLENTDENKIKGSNISYFEHISYVLHLCKKKQIVYENLVEGLKDKMNEELFRTAIMEKKLCNFEKYQQQLRYLVQKQSSKDTIVRCILRFGH